MDDTAGSGATARPAGAGSGARPTKSRAKPKSAASARTTKAARAPAASPSARSARAGRAVASGDVAAGTTGLAARNRQEQGPWRRARNRALYSRRLQRADESWGLASRVVAGLMSHPEPVLGALGRKEPVERDGRILNRGVQALLELSGRFGRGGGGPELGGPSTDPVVMRRQFVRSARLAMPVRTDVHVWDRAVPGPAGAPAVPVRLYRPYGSGLGLGGDGHLIPAVVYFHGGGWAIGDLDTHDATCRMLASAARCLVVSVSYRLAPEDPFPAAVDDALAAYTWAQRHCHELGVDPRQVGVMGDSAGGTLAAVVALETRAGGAAVDADVVPPAAQGLIYPVLDVRFDTESMRELGEGFLLTRAALEGYRSLYLPDVSDWTVGRVSPLLAEDHRGVAPALIVTAGFDPLRDDGSNYAEALRSAGVEVEYRCYDDQIHGFMGMGILSDSLALATEVCDAMGRLLRRSAWELPT